MDEFHRDLEIAVAILGAFGLVHAGLLYAAGPMFGKELSTFDRWRVVAMTSIVMLCGTDIVRKHYFPHPPVEPQHNEGDRREVNETDDVPVKPPRVVSSPNLKRPLARSPQR